MKVAILEKIPPSFTKTAWHLPDKISERDWERAALQLGRAQSGLQWWYGDWWLKGKQQKWWVYGEGTEKAKIIGVPYKTITNYASICKAFPPNRRRENLTFSIHGELRGFSCEIQEALLNKAEQEGFGVRGIRRHLTYRKAKTAPAIKGNVKMSVTRQFLMDVGEEIERARAKFPGDDVTMIALVEELGELAKALLEESPERVWKEAVQTATMAARVAIDGDNSVDLVRAKRHLGDCRYHNEERK